MGYTKVVVTIRRKESKIFNDAVQIGNVRAKEEGWQNPQAGRVYDIRGFCPTLNTMQGGCRQPIVIIPIMEDDNDNKKSMGNGTKG